MTAYDPSTVPSRSRTPRVGVSARAAACYLLLAVLVSAPCRPAAAQQRAPNGGSVVASGPAVLAPRPEESTVGALLIKYQAWVIPFTQRTLHQAHPSAGGEGPCGHDDLLDGKDHG